MANLTDQWNLEAKCNECRRNRYCSHPCTLFKRINAVEIQKHRDAFLKSRTKKFPEVSDVQDV